MTIDATYLLQLTLNGITLGLIYALIAVGLSLIFGVMEIINFAHGELLMLGAFAMAFALPVMGLLYWPALATAILATMMIGWVIYELLLVRLKPDEFERSILITLGLSIIIIHVMQYVFTATPRLVDTQYGFEGVEIGSIRITWTRIIGAAASLAAFALIIIGGLGNIPGAIVAGIGLGLIENWIGGFFEIAWQEAAVFVIMIAVLFLRPDGLFKRGGMRVG
jgi:branched-chain amino acid transport system permease protein